MHNTREKLVELFYDNNVRCDQKIEGLADDVMDIIANGVTIQKWNHASIAPKDGLYIVKLKNGNKFTARCNCGKWIMCEGYKDITEQVVRWTEIA